MNAWPIHAKRLTWLSVATIVAGATAAGLILFYAPNDADQGFVQKIFYLHVPMALVALAGFLAAAIMAIKYLRSGDRSWDLRSYVAIHLSIIFGVGVLATVHAPARPFDDGRPHAGRDAAHVHRGADRDGFALHDALDAGAGGEAGGDRAATPAAPDRVAAGPRPSLGAR